MALSGHLRKRKKPSGWRQQYLRPSEYGELIPMLIVVCACTESKSAVRQISGQDQRQVETALRSMRWKRRSQKWMCWKCIEKEAIALPA